MSGGAIVKIILGLVLLAAGLWLILPASVCGLAGLWACKGMWAELWLVIQGIVPAGLIGIGLMLVWIEAEELAVRKKK